MSYEKNTISGAKGITFAGETFVVPETHDVIETLFNPLLKKSHFELIILLVLALNGIVFWLVQDSQLRVSIFIVLYVFWRLSYNFGIGYLLREQSNHSKLVNWAKKYATFDTNNGGWLTKVLRAEVKSQMSPGYEIEDYPIEFNTWLIFRKIVDLILMLDFFSFMGLVVASSINKDYQFINDQSTWLVSLRLIVGSVLILFNYWVKVNAHNTIKDYAWYWGDFFFRQVNNEELIFDGVFEMFPHPMYSVGYIGYYGFALISKSYTVLIVAIFGHFLQMIFLHFIEDPHIDKIYGNPDDEAEKILELRRLKIFDNQKPLVGLWNFSYLRASDLVNVIITFTYAILIPYLSSFQSGESDNLGKALFILAVILKLLESLIIDILLILQSYYKTFTRWYLAHDIPVEKSLNNWAVIFNTLINLTYSSFFGLNFYRFLTNSHQSLYDWFYLRCFLGVLLIATQVWINSSIIDSIGYFGWFYGDFFIPKAKSGLTKAGVYRYLNNPEQLFGSCGIMGVTLISPTLENFVCCILWVVNNFVRINFIEKIHMISIYGVHEVLKDSGVTKTVKKHLLPTAIQRRFSDSNGTKRSSLTESLDSFIREMRNSENKLTRHNIIDLSKNLKFSDSDYQISFKAENYTTGMPIEVYWEAPPNHSSRDWIGLYKIVQTTFSRNKTLISSSGRWVWCTENKGTHIFSGEKLFWEEGVYEFRYHLDGKHDVAFISQPFEIRHPKIDLTEDIENDALNLKESIFRFLIPVESIDSPLAAEAQKLGAALKDYKTLSNLILAATGIKIDWKLFLEDGLTLRKLSAKLLNIRDVLDKLSSPHEVSTVKKNE